MPILTRFAALIRAAFGADAAQRGDRRRRAGGYRGACRRGAAMVGDAWCRALDARRRGLPRPDDHASAGEALHLADRRRRRCSPRRSACGWSTTCAAPTWRRAGRARRWCRSITPRLARDLPRPLAVREYRRRRPTSPGSAPTTRCSPSTPGRATRRSTTGAPGAPGLRFDTDGALAASQARSIERASSASASTATSRRSRPSRSTAATSTITWADGLSAADGAATLTRGTRARHRAGGAALPARRCAMGDLRRRRAQSRRCSRRSPRRRAARW